ncbi:MAG: glycerol-3-phosphate 1-O-acyltransferase PlsY [Eubacteriales bacterium]|nr:glycerol-3-phosphate 1-O-acyltransferase PlsY [Eubacteriales bacterium]
MITDIIIRGLITAVVAYLFGSISFAVIFTKISSKKDIREMGSGNAGFTNVLRSVGAVPAVFTLVFDFIKGAIASLLGIWLFSTITTGSELLSDELIIYGGYLGGVFAIIGHMYPVYFGFKGGKGIVTAAAMMAVADWRVFLLILGTFLVMFVFTKIISLSSITCAALYGPYTFVITFFFDSEFPARYVVLTSLFALSLGIFVIIKHKENIKRLLKGEEKKITAKKKESKES